MSTNDSEKQSQPAGENPGREIPVSKLVQRVRLNQGIGYRGRIGRRREQYCLEQIRYMGVCHQKIKQDQLEYVKSRGESISCGAGCSFCCRAVYVGASLQECEAIAYYLSHHEPLLASFLSVYAPWRETVKRGGDRFQDCERLFADMLRSGNSAEKEKNFQKLLRRHNKQGIACPFLVDNLCSIYEVRPSNCAGFFVTHSPELCRPREYHEPKFSLTAIDDVLYDTSFYYKALAFPVTLYMPVAVFRILDEGYSYLSSFPGLESIASEFLNDPEVQGIARI